MNAQAFPHKARLEQHPGALLLHSERASKAKQSRGAKNRCRRSLIRALRPPQTPRKKIKPLRILLASPIFSCLLLSMDCA